MKVKVQRYTAQVEQSCDRCPDLIRRGGQMAYVNPPGVYVHEKCVPEAVSVAEKAEERQQGVRGQEAGRGA